MKVLCAFCGREVWYWRAHGRIGRPERTYCSRDCARRDTPTQHDGEATP